MLRYSMFLIATVGFIAGVIASALPDRAAATGVPDRNETVIVKNQAWPVFGPLDVEECETEDCSETAVPGIEV